jgi:hypothetical protein
MDISCATTFIFRIRVTRGTCDVLVYQERILKRPLSIHCRFRYRIVSFDLEDWVDHGRILAFPQADYQAALLYLAVESRVQINRSTVADQWRLEEEFLFSRKIGSAILCSRNEKLACFLFPWRVSVMGRAFRQWY